MKKILVFCLALVLVALGGRVGLGKWQQQQSKTAIRSVVLAAMKDPASAQWRNEVLSADNKTLCGEVNAKNSMGGYVGFKPYIANQKGYLVQGAPFNTWSMADNKTRVPDYMVKGARMVDSGQDIYLARDVFEFFWKSNCT